MTEKRIRRDKKRRKKQKQKQHRDRSSLPFTRELTPWERKWKSNFAADIGISLNMFLHWTETPPDAKMGRCMDPQCMDPDCLSPDFEALNVIGSEYNGPLVVLLYTDAQGMHHLRINGSQDFQDFQDDDDGPNADRIRSQFGQMGIEGVAQALQSMETHGLWVLDEEDQNCWRNPGTGLIIRRKTFNPDGEGFIAVPYEGKSEVFELAQDEEPAGPDDVVMYVSFRRAANDGLMRDGYQSGRTDT